MEIYYITLYYIGRPRKAPSVARLYVYICIYKYLYICICLAHIHIYTYALKNNKGEASCTFAHASLSHIRRIALSRD